MGRPHYRLSQDVILAPARVASGCVRRMRAVIISQRADAGVFNPKIRGRAASARVQHRREMKAGSAGDAILATVAALQLDAEVFAHIRNS
jgi:hypothetical protein